MHMTCQLAEVRGRESKESSRKYCHLSPCDAILTAEQIASTAGTGMWKGRNHAWVEYTSD